MIGSNRERNVVRVCAAVCWGGALRDETKTAANETKQYSSQIVETDSVSLEFSGKYLRFTPYTFVRTVMCPLPPQC